MYPETEDENCRSIQSILSHVVHAGYGYATSIRNLDGSNTPRPGKTIYTTTKACLEALDNLFAFTDDVFRKINDNELEQFDSLYKIKTAWGQLYDIEQMTEHAIVHILRHNRQIEKICAERLGL